MNTLPKFSEQYDKIIDAYFKNEIKPYDAKFCFCGTLNNNDSRWCVSSFLKFHADFGNYKGVEYVRMENALFESIEYSLPNSPEYEDFLFKGMCAALEVLKQIHIEHGEVIDEVVPFTKRELEVK